MEATLSGNRILVTFPHRGREYAPLVAGGRWRSGSQTWSYPLSLAKCKEMRKAWGDELRVEKKLGAWYRTAEGERVAQTARSTATDAKLRRLPNVAPELYRFIGGDQKADAVWIANAYEGGGILAHEPGLGKTYSVVAGLVEMNPLGPILVVCPKVSVRNVWQRHLKDVEWPVYAARGTRAKREKALNAFLADPSPTKVLIVVAEMLRAKGNRDGHGKRFTCTGFEYPELFGMTWTAVVLDESHKLLGAMTITKGNLMSEGLRQLDIAPAPLGLRLAVSGTPFGRGGDPEGMFGTLHWCWPRVYTSFWRWAEENFDVTDEKVFIRGGRGATMKVKKIHGLKGGKSEEQFFKELGPRIIRRTLEEVSPAHRGLRGYDEIICDMEGEQLRQYKEFAANAEVILKEGGILTANGVLAEMTRARQIANGALRKDGEGAVHYTGESGKLDSMEQRLEEMGLIGEPNYRLKRRKVVIASQYNEFLYAATARLDKLGTPYYLMTGATSDAKRDRMMDDFQDRIEGPRLFIMNAKAGGVSITLDSADWLFQLDEMFPPEANEQLHRRIFRRSRVHSARVVYFRSEGTIDERIAGTVGAKLAEQLKVLDGRRGLEVVRDVIRYRGTEA